MLLEKIEPRKMGSEESIWLSIMKAKISGDVNAHRVKEFQGFK